MNSNFDSAKIASLLKPCYVDLMNDTKRYENIDLITFCIQWGKYYPSAKNEGIMFYGRANNGWMCFDRDAEEVFNQDNPERAFNREDQMIWVEECANNLGKYNTNKSAFWRVVRKVSRDFFQDNELEKICWSNLCKVAPNGKNPSDPLYYAQLTACQNIMKTEIEIFSPKHVVLLTGWGWAKDFIQYLNNGNELIPVEVYKWSSYEIKVYRINDVYFYLSEHPQGKNEANHINCLIEAIQSRK